MKNFCEVRHVCFDEHHFTHRIEPSVEGGARVAAAILGAAMDSRGDVAPN